MPMEALTPKERAEVEVEVALLAELQHPNIVRYYNQCVCLAQCFSYCCTCPVVTKRIFQ